MCNKMRSACAVFGVDCSAHQNDCSNSVDLFLVFPPLLDWVCFDQIIFSLLLIRILKDRVLLISAVSLCNPMSSTEVDVLSSIHDMNIFICSKYSINRNFVSLMGWAHHAGDKIVHMVICHTYNLVRDHDMSVW